MGIDTLPIPIPVPGTAFAALKKSFTPDAVYVMLLALGIGAAAGFVARALAPDGEKKGTLGWIGSIVGGGIAAVAALAAAIPTDAVKFTGQCLIAGYAGKTFLEAMKAKSIAGTRYTRLRSIGRLVDDARTVLKSTAADATKLSNVEGIANEIERLARKED